MTHVRLLPAFGVHVASGVLFFIGASLLVAVAVRDSPFEIWGELIEEVLRHPAEFLAGFSIFTGVVETGAFAWALLIGPWGARDERLRTTLYHAVRTVWLQSPQATVVLLAMLGTAACLKELEDSLRRQLVPWTDWPWYCHNEEEIVMYVGLAGLSWAVWGVLRALGARPIHSPTDLPPTCQRCGYNLTGAKMAGVCTECGEPVAASIGPRARRGIRWEHRSGGGRPRSWWRCAWHPIRRPEEFGRRLRVYSPPEGHRRFLLINIVIAGVTGTLGALLWLVGLGMSGRYYMHALEDALWLTAPVSGFLTGTAVLAITLLFSGLLGLAFGWGQRRNVMPAAVRAASYLSGYLVLWLGINTPGAFVYGVSSDVGVFDTLGHWLRMDDDAVALTTWCLLNVPFLFGYLRLLQRALQGARYATR
ncbi:MAG: hypothetical protein HY718_05425 [Planctomycetes bacterium]|nr:hypothetical protein [Planctomycetota bacterium]